MWPPIVYYTSLALLGDLVASNIIHIAENTLPILPDLDTPSIDNEAVSDERPLCPPEKSLYTKEDITSLIDYQIESLSIYQKIKNSFYTDAVSIRDKHIGDFKLFKNWFQERPEHLKHILEDLNSRKLRFEPLVKNTARVLEEYPQLQERFDEQSYAAERLLENFYEYKFICDSFCNKMHLQSRPISNIRDGYYCSSLVDLHRDIQSNLMAFATKVITEMRIKVTNDDGVYEYKIETLKNELKDVALKQFGRTMYDILDLQDDYHHFFEDNIIRLNAKSNIYNIKENGLEIDSKLLDLQKMIENYAGVCRSCTLNVLKIERRHKEEGSSVKDKNVIGILLEEKQLEIFHSVNNVYSNIFQELNTLLNKTDTMDVYSNDLKPIQEDVTKELQNQRTLFNELKSIIPQYTINKLRNLVSDSQELLRKLNILILDLEINSEDF